MGRKYHYCKNFITLVKVLNFNSFGTNQIYSDLFLNLNSNSSKSKKVFNLVWCKSDWFGIKSNPKLVPGQLVG